MTWGAIGGAAISVVGGMLLSDDGGSGQSQTTADAYSAMQAEIARDQWERYKKVYAPLEDQLVGEAQDYGKPWRYDAAASQAEATVNQQFDKARMQMQRTPGLDPSSGAYMAGLANLELGRAASSASAQNIARKGVDDTAYARKQSVVGLGKGLDSTAASTLGGLANHYSGLAASQQANSQQQNMQMAGALGRVTERAINGLTSSGWLGGNYSSTWSPVSQPMGNDIFFGA